MSLQHVILWVIIVLLCLPFTLPAIVPLLLEGFSKNELRALLVSEDKGEASDVGTTS